MLPAGAFVPGMEPLVFESGLLVMAGVGALWAGAFVVAGALLVD